MDGSFTPHSTKINLELIKKSKNSLYWDPSRSIFGTPGEGPRRRRWRGITTLRLYPELGGLQLRPDSTRIQRCEKRLVGRRQVPFGIGWVVARNVSLDELPLRVIRLAYREFSRNPDLTLDGFKARLGESVLGSDATPQRVDDLLTLQAAFNRERDWFEPSPLVEPLRVKEMKATGKLTAAGRPSTRPRSKR